MMFSKILTNKFNNEKRLKLHQKDIPSIRDIMLENELYAIQMYPSSEGGKKNIDFLQSVADLVKELNIFTESNSKVDFTGLEVCTNLEDLQVEVPKKSPIDISNNTKLKKIYIDDCVSLTGLENLEQIESLIIGRNSSKILNSEFFSRQKPKFKTLSLSHADLSGGLGFLENQRLQSLWIFTSKGVNLEALSRLGIKNLLLDGCRDIKNIDELSRAHTLEEIKIIDSDVLPSARIFASLNSLKTLAVLGKSSFVEGDLSCLKNKLHHFSFDNKRHYSIKNEEFDDKFLLKE